MLTLFVPPLGTPPSPPYSPIDDERRAFTFFEGLLFGLGANIDVSALPRAFGDRCGLLLGSVYRDELLPGITELHSAADIHQTTFDQQADRIFAGMYHLGKALRGFAATGHRCHAPTVSGRLSQHASRLMYDMNNASAVRPDVNGVYEMHIGGFDVGGQMRRASKNMISEGRYRQAGLAMGLALLYAADGDEDGGDEPLGPRDIWGGFTMVDPRGRIRDVAALEAHFRQLRAARLEQLMFTERQLAALPVPELRGNSDGTPVGGECCCCWAEPSDAQERGTRTNHVF